MDWWLCINHAWFKVYDIFKEYFGWKSLDDNFCTSIKNWLIRVIKYRNIIKLNLRQVEHLLCKYYHYICSTSKDSKWHEMMMLSQPKIAMYGDQVAIRTVCSQLYYRIGSLIKSFPFVRDSISTLEFANYTGVVFGKSLPVERKLFRHRLSENFIYNYHNTKVRVSHVPKDENRNPAKILLNLMQNDNSEIVR